MKKSRLSCNKNGVRIFFCLNRNNVHIGEVQEHVRVNCDKIVLVLAFTKDK